VFDETKKNTKTKTGHRYLFYFKNQSTILLANFSRIMVAMRWRCLLFSDVCMGVIKIERTLIIGILYLLNIIDFFLDVVVVVVVIVVIVVDVVIVVVDVAGR